MKNRFSTSELEDGSPTGLSLKEEGTQNKPFSPCTLFRADQEEEKQERMEMTINFLRI